MKSVIIQRLILAVLLTPFVKVSYSQNITLEVGQEDPEPSSIILPFAFHTESLDTALGAFLGGSGHFQPQSSVFASVFTTTNDSVAGFFGVHDAQLPFAKRLFLTLRGSKGYYTNQLVYAGFNSTDPNDRAGSNDSSSDNYIQGEGDDDRASVNGCHDI